jgi:hypothetical protein
MKSSAVNGKHNRGIARQIEKLVKRLRVGLHGFQVRIFRTSGCWLEPTRNSGLEWFCKFALKFYKGSFCFVIPCNALHLPLLAV